MNPLNIDTREELFGILNEIPFIDQLNTHNMHVKYQHFVTYMAQFVLSLRLSSNVNKSSNIYPLKNFVNELGKMCRKILQRYRVSTGQGKVRDLKLGQGKRKKVREVFQRTCIFTRF